MGAGEKSYVEEVVHRKIRGFNSQGGQEEGDRYEKER